MIFFVSSSLPLAAGAAGPERPLAEAPGLNLREGFRTMGQDALALLNAPRRWDSQDWLLAGGALTAVGASFAIDSPLDRWVARNQHSSAFHLADDVSTAISPYTVFGANVGLIAVGWVQESYGYSSRLKQTGLVSLEAEIFAMAATFFLKEVSGRARPNSERGATHFEPFTNGGPSSFSSAHAAASFSIASVLADRYEYGWLAYVPAVAVAGSRIYTREHFASDVLAGSLIGWGLGTFLSRLHADPENRWRVQPTGLLDHAGFGIALGRNF
jgi:hypothetical protein